MRDLVGSGAPEALKAHLIAEEVAADAKAARMTFVEIQKAVQPQMVKWDKENTPVDIPTWINQRAAMEKQVTVTEMVNRDLKEWQLKNPQQKGETAESYATRLEQKMRTSQQEQEKLYEQMLAEQAQKREGMSREEFMREYAKLIQLRAAAENLALRLARIRSSPHRSTPWRNEIIAKAEAQLENMSLDIATREAILNSDAITSGSLWKQWIIPAAVGVSMAAGAMADPANEI